MTKVQDAMTANPTCCSPSTPLPEVAQKMVQADCGCIPVLDEGGKPVGVITDRDIACRAVAENKNPGTLTAADCMTGTCVVVRSDESLEDCCKRLEDNQIRRAVVVDEQGRCCGIIAQADIAKHASGSTAASVVKSVSQATDQPSRVGCC